jgi:hypothetical protein
LTLNVMIQTSPRPAPFWVFALFIKALGLIFALFIGFYSPMLSADTCFDAQTLSGMQRHAADNTLVYVWSPRMVLSAQHAADVQQQAELAGLRWVAVHDPRLPADERMAALGQLARTHPASAQALGHSLALCDAQLIARDALRHFPSAFVWRGALVQGGAGLAVQGWVGTPIVGAMPVAFWAMALRERMRP